MKNIQDETLEFLQNRIRDTIQNFYDDPDGMCGPFVSNPTWGDIRQKSQAIDLEKQRLKRIAEDVGENFEQIVAEEATDFEVARVEALIRGEDV